MRASKIRHTPATANNGTVEEHLWEAIASHRRNWEERLSIFLLAYRASAHDITGFVLTSLVFGRDLWLTCDLLFGANPAKKYP